MSRSVGRAAVRVYVSPLSMAIDWKKPSAPLRFRVVARSIDCGSIGLKATWSSEV